MLLFLFTYCIHSLIKRRFLSTINNVSGEFRTDWNFGFRKEFGSRMIRVLTQRWRRLGGMGTDREGNFHLDKGNFHIAEQGMIHFFFVPLEPLKKKTRKTRFSASFCLWCGMK